MDTKTPKPNNILYIFEKLSKGEVVNRKEVADYLGVHTKTISRYIDDINAYLANSNRFESVIYSRRVNGYVLEDTSGELLNSREILLLSKILLESRGLNKKETERIIGKLISYCSYKEKLIIEEMIVNELFNYAEPRHSKTLLDSIWEISQAIASKKYIEVEYQKVGHLGKVEEKSVKRILQPEAIIFSEYYFYLVAYQKEEAYEYPTIYRIDRIVKYKILKEGFNVPYKDKFKPGEFRNLIQFMQPGKMMKVRFMFCGKSVEAVLDRLPTAKIISEDKGTYLIEAKVFGDGIKMWLLSQGETVKVIEPEGYLK